MEQRNFSDTIGYHYIVEASGCNPEILSDSNKIRDIFIEAAKLAKMDVRSSYFFRFYPFGVSGVVIISESHISTHTWPEKGYAALDVYTCGNTDPEVAVKYILEKFEAKHAHFTEIKRGIFEEEDNTYTHMFVTWDEKITKE
ncbi:MAG: adenosylmethionine decarboxylase [Candidatus Woesearchaeota archaeon]